jgi:tRNA(fMet)-specific endonuclease VapC
VEPDLTDAFAISVVTVSELLHGVHRAPVEQRAARQAAVEAVLERFAALPITIAEARVHARLAAELSSSGKTVGSHDLWIGATALAHGLGVMTRNPRDFARIPELRVLTA